MTGIDLVTLITNIGFPAGFAVTLLWLMSTKIESLVEIVREISNRLGVLNDNLDIISEVRNNEQKNTSNAKILEILEDIKNKLDRLEYLITKDIQR